MKKKYCKIVSFFIVLAMLAVYANGVMPTKKAQALTGAGDIIRNHTFEGGVGLPWHIVTTYPADASFDISGGKYNVTIKDKGTERWDVQFRHRGLTIEKGHTYTVKFTVSATKDCKIYPKIGDQGDPYDEYWNYNKNWEFVSLKANTAQTITQKFTMEGATKKNCEFAFHLGGECATSALPYTISFSKMYVEDPDFDGYPDEIPEPTNEIRVNQEGYYPGLNKEATLVSTSTAPADWKLVNSSGKTITSGKTKVLGEDHASGDRVHIIDFSSCNTEGQDYKLVSGSAESMPFNIGTDMYTQLKYDAMKYFYHNRSGIEIEMPYCEQDQWARPAGHTNDVLKPDPSKSYKGSYSLDIVGGWYDAGDHGKYVVNGGISVWTLMNAYERALLNDGNTSVAPFADDSLNIPESGNGLPDILDETRWEVEMLMKMQVPSGSMKGMAHHKAHDERWTALGLRPDQDEMDRYLQPPSTAATLNLAAIAAQASRLWKEHDSSFASECLTVAETAWDAAEANPDVYAPMEQGPGGGAYGDNYVEDEFYWAACELFVTTGDSKYLDYMKSSKHYLEMPSNLVGGEALGLTGCFDWGNVAGLGTISLALVPNELESSEVEEAKANIKAAADAFIAIEDKQGYGAPIEEKPISSSFTGEEIVGYPWGSNSFVANNAIVMSYAYEFSNRKDEKYLNGAAIAMDYLMGRNPNLQCYVSGYGENPVENPHHRFWAYQADNSFPKAPAGCLVGGPNSGLEDPWVKGSGWQPGVKSAQKCYMDNIESWSTNEITINWNAPLAWVTAYLDEQGPEAKGGVATPTPTPTPTKKPTPTPTKKPTPTPKPTPTSPPKASYGDVNGDGNKDALDYAALKKYILTPEDVEIKEENADVNADGVINALDLALLKQYLLEIINKFPAEK